MDRCRCDEYKEAVKKLRFYTVGTLRPDLIENCDRSGIGVYWMRHGVDHDDLKFTKPKAFELQKTVRTTEPESEQMKEIRKVERMWCPYMTPVKK